MGLTLWVSLKLLRQLGASTVGMVVRWSPFRIVSNDPIHQPRFQSTDKVLTKNPSETASPIVTKLCFNGLLMIPFRMGSDLIVKRYSVAFILIGAYLSQVSDIGSPEPLVFIGIGNLPVYLHTYVYHIPVNGLNILL